MTNLTMKKIVTALEFKSQPLYIASLVEVAA